MLSNPRSTGLSTTLPIVCLAAILAMLAFGPAHAGDSAEARVIGFSGDGRHFAFEQFGVQDGSGFPYADIFVIDAERDVWAPDTPVRVLLKDETAELSEARQRAADQAAPILRKFGIKHPGRLLASNPAAELGNDPHRLTVNRRYQIEGAVEAQSFQLTELPLSAPEGCKGMSGEPMVGFRLQSQKSGASAVTLHEDRSLPESRGCPLGYAISAVVGYRPPDRPEVLAVLVGVSQIGFEGPDRRYLAVTHVTE